MCSTLTASSFRIWNSSAEIPSPSLVLFVVILPKAHLTSHSRMSGCKWVTTPSWLSRLLKLFLYSSSVYSCHLFLIVYASVRFLLFLTFIVPILSWNVPLISLIFLKRSLVFPILLFSSISFHWSLRKPFLSLLAILWNSAFKWVCLSFSPLPFASLFFTAILTVQNIQGQEILRVIPKSMLKKQTIISTRGSEISKTRKVWNGQEKWRSRAQTKMREEKSRRSKVLEEDEVRKLWSNRKHF